ncbi:uncharacterized protein LOC118404542 isoform X1 [Branchiostoma floridae]|uniref:Uncharacterized protein LOC118404542 isoform X1 n=1 Tax=Branchiostoma floridae TaxID=7739 RepID=A0A9J7HLR8_BRAFL|nr:uncharacterized protein LOC118404542 isoform X1 [Branchiostoma floridae]
MESDFARETSGRRCKVCRLPVRGHPGPYGRGKCKFERREGSSDEEYFKQQRGSSHVEEKLQSLRRESKVSDLVRAAWSDSISEDTDETQVRQSRSLNLKRSSGRSRENASTRARSEPPVQSSRHRTRSSSSEATATRDKAKPDIRDLRKSRGLVKEVDKALDELLNPDISHGKQPRSKRYQDRGSVSSSSQSDSTESDFVREPARRRQRRRGSRGKSGKMTGKHVSSKRPVSRRRSDSYDSDTSSGMADDSRSRSTKRRRRRAGKSGKMKGKHVSSKRSVSRRRCDSYDSDTSSGMSDDSRSRSTKRRRRRAARIDLGLLRDQVRQTKRAAFADGTWENLRTHLRTYLLFCTFYDIVPFPAKVDTLETYAEFLSRSFRAPASIANYVSGIKTFHILFGLDTAAFSSMDLALLLRGLKKQMRHTPRQKLPFTPDVLLRIHEHLDTSDSFQATMWTVILLSFFTFQRKSNFVSKHGFDPTKQFTIHDFVVYKGILLIRIRWSKTLQCAERVLYVPVMEIKNSPLCPVSAFCNMVRLNRNKNTSAAFVRPHRGRFVPLNQNIFDKAFKQILGRAGLSPARYSLHSGRRGGATFAFRAGVPIDLIRLQGDWRSDAYLLYLKVPLATRLRLCYRMVKHIQWKTPR